MTSSNFISNKYFSLRTWSLQSNL